MTKGWRFLVGFWVFTLTAVVTLLVFLQVANRSAVQEAPARSGATGPSPAAIDVAPDTGRSASPTPGTSPGPDASRNSVPAAGSTDARAAATDSRRRVAIVVAGIGLSAEDSQRASQVLPPAVTFAVSPYGENIQPLLAAIRQQGHEYLLSLPMEPASYPLNDAGPHALLTGASTASNDANLTWIFGRLSGEVGATGALDGMRGERFAAVPSVLDPVLTEVDKRGLFYIDPRPGVELSGKVDGRDVDLVIDEVPDRAAIDMRLQQLVEIARTKGVALGLSGPPRRVLIDSLAAWSQTLDAKGIQLVAVSRLIRSKLASGDGGR